MLSAMAQISESCIVKYLRGVRDQLTRGVWNNPGAKVHRLRLGRELEVKEPGRHFLLYASVVSK